MLTGVMTDQHKSIESILAVHPLKINMEPKNHPFEKETHLNQTSILGFQIFIFQGVYMLHIRRKLVGLLAFQKTRPFPSEGMLTQNWVPN